MPLFVLVAGPLALFGVLAFSLARRERDLAAAARPSLAAAHLVTRELSGRLEEGTVLRVFANVRGQDVVVSIPRRWPTASIEVASPTPMRPLEVTLRPIGGRELADYPDADVLLATDGTAASLWGTRGAGERLPRGMRAAMERVGASWISVAPATTKFIGLDAPTRETDWPRFAERLDHALALGRAIASNNPA